MTDELLADWERQFLEIQSRDDWTLDDLMEEVGCLINKARRLIAEVKRLRDTDDRGSRWRP
jgi:hypothetical protein